MTREEVKKHWDMIKAFAEGKTLQSAYYDRKGDIHWKDETYPIFDYDSMYRIKREYRPFKFKEECFEEMKNHKPFGWIKDKDCSYNISRIDKDGIYLSDWENNIECYDFEQALNDFTFMDGTVFGIKEG